MKSSLNTSGVKRIIVELFALRIALRTAISLLEKRRLRGDLITMYQYLKGSYKEDGDSLFTRSHMVRTRGNGCKLLPGRFQLDTRDKFFTMRTVNHWNNLPREVVDSAMLNTFKTQLDMVLGHLV